MDMYTCLDACPLNGVHEIVKVWPWIASAVVGVVILGVAIGWACKAKQGKRSRNAAYSQVGFERLQKGPTNKGQGAYK